MSRFTDMDAEFFGDLFGEEPAGGKSAAQRKAEQRARQGYNSVERRKPEDAARRRRLERNPAQWLR